jgi:hypothetical protein
MFEFKNKILIGVVILVVAFFLEQFSDGHNYKSWPTAPALLTSAKVVVGSHGRTTGPKRRYFAVETTYEFTVDGRVYYSGRLGIGVPRFDTDKEALQYLDELKSRPAHIVHYHPDTPEKNALSP